MTETTWEQIWGFSSGPSEDTVLMSSPEARSFQNWNAIEMDLLALRRLEDNWDDLGALAPAPELVDSALVFMKMMHDENPSIPPNRVVAGPLGEIVFEWQRLGLVVEAEIATPEIVEFCWTEEDKESKIWERQFSSQSHQDSSWENSSTVDCSAVA